MLSKKTPYGEEMEIQTEYKWTTGCGFIWWLIFLVIFFTFATFKYDRLSTIKNQSSYKSMEPLTTIPIVINGTALTPKFRINLGTNFKTYDKYPICDSIKVNFHYSSVTDDGNHSNIL